MAKTNFVNGDPSQGIMGTVVTAEFLNAVNRHRHMGTDEDGDGAIDFAVDTGTANAYNIALTPPLTSYIVGMPVHFRAANANTGPSTLNINNLGPVSIRKAYNQPLTANDILANQIVSVIYDGTNFQLVSTIQQTFTDTDEKTKVSSNDTTAGYLNGKLVAGTNITLQENNDGENETLSISASLTIPDASITAAKLVPTQFCGDYVMLKEAQPSGTDAGSAAADTWNNRVLTHKVIDSAGICTFTGPSANFTLEAGTYIVFISATACRVGGHKLRLYNVSDNTTIISGLQGWTMTGSDNGQVVTLHGQFTITSPKTLKIMHYTASARGGDGLGKAVSSGEGEVYTIAEFWRVK